MRRVVGHVFDVLGLDEQVRQPDRVVHVVHVGRQAHRLQCLGPVLREDPGGLSERVQGVEVLVFAVPVVERGEQAIVLVIEDAVLLVDNASLASDLIGLLRVERQSYLFGEEPVDPLLVHGQAQPSADERALVVSAEVAHPYVDRQIVFRHHRLLACACDCVLAGMADGVCVRRSALSLMASSVPLLPAARDCAGGSPVSGPGLLLVCPRRIGCRWWR